MSATNAKNVLLWLCKIIQTQMALTPDQVWIYDQKRIIPPTTNLWVVVRFLTGKPYCNRSEMIDGIEYQSVNMNSGITVDIFSRDDSALARKEEILMAFGSIFAQRRQELYAFKIARIPIAFTDLSLVEGAAINYRFSLTLQVQYKTELQRTVDYYDTFSDSIITEA